MARPSKLTPEQKAKVISDARNGRAVAAIAKERNVTVQYIYKILAAAAPEELAPPADLSETRVEIATSVCHWCDMHPQIETEGRNYEPVDPKGYSGFRRFAGEEKKRFCSLGCYESYDLFYKSPATPGSFQFKNDAELKDHLLRTNAHFFGVDFDAVKDDFSDLI